jgi:zona occludens toxin (predicted ATPase)
VLFVFAAALVILVLVLAVPIAYRYLWPIKIKRPKPFLLITLTIGLVIAAVAISWFLDVPVHIGISDASRATDASHAALQAVLRNRLLVAAVFAVLVEYLVCRITQTITDA